MLKLVLTPLVVLTAGLLAACQLSNPPGQQDWLTGRLLLWHSLQDQEATVLTAAIEQYTKLYPEVKIIQEYVPAAELTTQFLANVQQGLGPDLLLANHFDIPQLVTSGNVQTLTQRQIDTSSYLSATLSQVTYQGQLYGIPFAIDTQALCYNKDRVSQPARTLNDLLWAAASGKRVALTNTFTDTFWGLSIFKRQQTNSKNALQLLVDPMGVTQWLTWLQKAQDEPNFVLNDNREILVQAFAEGEFDYYVCQSYEIPGLQASLGAERLGVALLPSGPNHAAGPLMQTSVLFLSRAASSQNTDLALHLAQFLTNVRQQTKMTLETEAQLPINTEVRLDNRLTPTVAALFTQSKTAVSIPLDYVIQAEGQNKREITVRDFGEQLIKQVIEGQIEPSEAAAELARQVNQVFDPDQL